MGPGGWETVTLETLKDARNPKAAVRLTREGAAFGILPNLSGVVYRVAGGLFLAPIVTVAKDTKAKPD